MYLRKIGFGNVNWTCVALRTSPNEENSELTGSMQCEKAVDQMNNYPWSQLTDCLKNFCYVYMPFQYVLNALELNQCAST